MHNTDRVKPQILECADTVGEFIGSSPLWLEGLKGRDHWEDLGVGGTVTLRWTLGR